MEESSSKKAADFGMVPSDQPEPPRRAAAPKRFVRKQIPDWLLNDAALADAIALLPANYSFEVHKCVWRVLSTGAKRVALQLPEGLLMYALTLADIFTAFGRADHCFVLGDVTYGACCVDDFAAYALSADLLIHYGHSCLVPVDLTSVPCLYVFVDIKIDVDRLVRTVHLNLNANPIPGGPDPDPDPDPPVRNVVLAGTIQFGSAIRAAKPELERAGFRVLVPQSKPLSAGEVLGCTAPAIPRGSFGDGDGADNNDVALVFVADGRFHLEALMIANPGIRAFRYDPYIGSLFLEEYDHKGMKESRRNAVVKAREAVNWGVVLGTLGRQGNPRILDRLEKKMGEKELSWTVVLMSEITPGRLALFEDSVDVWIQIACPRLSIDWGDAFGKPILNPYEAEIALGSVPGWWEKTLCLSSSCCKDGTWCRNGNPQSLNSSCCKDGMGCGNGKPQSLNSSCCKDGMDCASGKACCGHKSGDVATDYPMDYYAQDGGEWNSTHLKKPSRPAPRGNIQSSPV